jgi:hypothetical protein
MNPFGWHWNIFMNCKNITLDKSIITLNGLIFESLEGYFNGENG